MKTIYKDFDGIHPLLRAMLAFNDYDYDGRTNVISVTSLMKPTNMIVLERSNAGSDRTISIEGLIPSVGGSALHDRLENALKHTTDEMWKSIGIADPEDLEIKVEQRHEMPVGDHIISGKYDVLFRYKGSKWQVADFKSMSVWGAMIGGDKKLAEFAKQMSLYRWLNQDEVDGDIDDIGVVLKWFTDWSKTDARAKKDYPQSRIGVEMVPLMGIAETQLYVTSKEHAIKHGMDIYAKTGSTGTTCPEDELWPRTESWAYYAKKDSKRATKVCSNEADAEELKSRAKDPTAYVEHRKAQKTRCAYCSVLDFCEQGLSYKVLGLIPEL